jgi:hypothetical protein
MEEENNNDEDNNTQSPPPSPTEQTEQTTTNDNQEQSSDSSEDDISIHKNNFWDGTQPNPSGTIANLFTTTGPKADWPECEAIAKFLYTNKDENKANKMQFDTHLVPFLIAIPGTARKL